MNEWMNEWMNVLNEQAYFSQFWSVKIRIKHGSWKVQRLNWAWKRAVKGASQM